MTRTMETRNDGTIVLNDYQLGNPEHPGSILQEELKSRGIRQKDFCGAIGVQPSYLSAIIHGTRNISAEMALRLEKALEIPATVWLTLQNNYDLEMLSPERRQPARPYPLRSRISLEPMLLRDENGYGDRRATVTHSVILPIEDTVLLEELASRLNWELE